MQINIKVGGYEQDVFKKDGCVSTKSDQLSSQMATELTTLLILKFSSFGNRF
jgi:hypothetical protein